MNTSNMIQASGREIERCLNGVKHHADMAIWCSRAKPSEERDENLREQVHSSLELLLSLFASLNATYTLTMEVHKGGADEQKPGKGSEQRKQDTGNTTKE